MTQPSRPARAWRLIRRISKAQEAALKAIGPIVACTWIAWQYHQARLDKRVEATLAYVTRYEQADTSTGKAQRALTASLWDHAGEIAEFRETRATEVDLAKVKSIIAERVVDSSAITFGGTSSLNSLDEVDDFYNALATCVQGHVCDRTTAMRFFGCASVDLVDDFGAVMERRERLATRYGWGVRWIAEQARADRSCQP